MFNWAYLDKEATPLGSFFVWILSRAQISSLTSEGFFIEVLSVAILETTKTGQKSLYRAILFYRSQFWRLQKLLRLSLRLSHRFIGHNFGDYKNCCQIFLIEVMVLSVTILETTKTYSNYSLFYIMFYRSQFWRLQKLKPTWFKGNGSFIGHNFGDYKNKRKKLVLKLMGFIGHNFGDYKNLKWYQLITP